MHPEGNTEELLDVIVSHDNICHYFDIPIQHTEDKILKRMGVRQQKATLEQIGLICEKLPDVVLRTAIITGFPGETEEDHEGCSPLRALKINRLCVRQFAGEGTLRQNSRIRWTMRLWKNDGMRYTQQEEITAEANEAFARQKSGRFNRGNGSAGNLFRRTYGDALMKSIVWF